jgi:hypothetical protein
MSLIATLIECPNPFSTMMKGTLLKSKERGYVRFYGRRSIEHEFM